LSCQRDVPWIEENDYILGFFRFTACVSRGIHISGIAFPAREKGRGSYPSLGSGDPLHLQLGVKFTVTSAATRGYISGNDCENLERERE
jgi:hypothetical protein